VVKTVNGFLLVVMTTDVVGFHGQPVVPVQVVADVNNAEVYDLFAAVTVLPVGEGDKLGLVLVIAIV
jgi:hypothetical protein